MPVLRVATAKLAENLSDQLSAALQQRQHGIPDSPEGASIPDMCGVGLALFICDSLDASRFHAELLHPCARPHSP